MERDSFITGNICSPTDFNSHAHVERDFCTLMPRLGLNIISTHTLTWSVTLEGEPATMQNVNFNSHAHVERDLPVIIVYHVI